MQQRLDIIDRGLLRYSGQMAFMSDVRVFTLKRQAIQRPKPVTDVMH